MPPTKSLDQESRPIRVCGDTQSVESSPIKLRQQPVSPGLISASTAYANAPVSWASLPGKSQLAILFLCRLVDFLQVASLQAYVFHQLGSISPDLTNAEISYQAGILQGCFTGSQVITAILWGKAADAAWCGRKRVLLIGLVGTAFSCLGYGFSKSFASVAMWRMVAGCVNGTVGIIRTMISEITKERKYQSRAFLILPLSFNVANILGPIAGGFLADPSKTLPSLFGPDAALGCEWMLSSPFALPSIVNCFLLLVTAAVAFFGLVETSTVRAGKFDLGLHIAAKTRSLLLQTPNSDDSHAKYSKLSAVPLDTLALADDEDDEDSDDENLASTGNRKNNLAPLPAASSHNINNNNNNNNNNNISQPRPAQLPFWRLWTSNVVLTLVSEALYDFHLGGFTNLWSLFLSTPRADPNVESSMPLGFTGGLGMQSSTVGSATAILGILGITLQMTFYPPVNAALGTLKSFQYFLPLFPIAYFLAPYLAAVPSSTSPPEAASGFFVWSGIVLVQFLQVTARTFTLPASIILLNNCSPHPSVLGTIHGLGQSTSAAFRTVGPIVSGQWYGAGLDMGVVGLGWWGIAAVSVVGVVSGLFLYNGSGHEICLQDDDENGI